MLNKCKFAVMLEEKFNLEIIRLYQEANNFGELLDMELELQDQGRICYKMPIKQKHLATPRAAHGGAVSALVDASLGVAALSKVSIEKKVVSTVEFKVNFMRPAILGDVLSAYAEVVSAGKRLIVAESKIYNQNKELVVFASGTFNAYPAEKAFNRPF